MSLPLSQYCTFVDPWYIDLWRSNAPRLFGVRRWNALPPGRRQCAAPGGKNRMAKAVRTRGAFTIDFPIGEPLVVG